MSKIFEMVNMLKNNNSSTSQINANTPNFEMPDMETMMKITQIMKTMNSSENNAGTNLLYSLKPFLRKSKQDKLSQYANILKISSVISELNKNNSSEKLE
jgi:hypothetical protein